MTPHHHHHHHHRRAFSMVELVITFIAIFVLLSCALALAPQAKHQAVVARSMANLRQIGTAALTYAAEFGDRQMTLVRDDLAHHGLIDRDADQGQQDHRTSISRCVDALAKNTGAAHPPIHLGWTKPQGGQPEMASLDVNEPENHWALMPVSFDAEPRGWFRLVNARPMSQYMNGRFYDPVYYAPNDEVAMNAVHEMFDSPEEFRWGGKQRIYWSSYSFSPAALWNPAVLARPKPDGQGGFTDPFSIASSFKCPTMSQATYANLKTHVMEHHWLHNRPSPPEAKRCNDKRSDGTYRGCEPHYFNHAAQSEPIALFYDGHLEKIAVNDAMEIDELVKMQSQTGVGLWHSKPGGARNGYYESEAVDAARASFHIFTVDGIKGRDWARLE